MDPPPLCAHPHHRLLTPASSLRRTARERAQPAPPPDGARSAPPAPCVAQCYPSYFSEELIDAIASIDKVCKYIDIPLQHLSPTVLGRMRRPGGKATLQLLRKLRARIPDLTLRTTFISGFPGESDEEHAELVGFARAPARLAASHRM